MAGNRILIVDDDPNLHNKLEEYLILSGYEVFHAKNGVEGLESMKASKPNLVLIDIQMPVMDGFQMVREIKKQPIYKNVYLLLLSSLNREFLKQKGIEFGANDFIAKPFSRSELLARVNNAFRLSAKNQASDGILRGDLSNLNLSELLQSMELGTKTGMIYLEDANGEIRIRDGLLVYVRQGAFTGREALIRIFLMERGSFSVKFTDFVSPISENAESLTPLLMDVLVNLDEIREMTAELNAENKQITIKGNLSEFPEIAKCRHVFPTSLIHLIVSMSGDLKDNIRIAGMALKRGAIGFAL